MNHRHRAPFRLLVPLTLTLAAGCAGTPGGGSDGGGGDGGTPAFADRAVLTELADEVVGPSLALLERRAVDLKTAVAALAATPDDAHLASAKQAWAAAHQAWALSETFSFGPATPEGLAADIDTWPVDTAGVDAVLAGTDPVTAATVAALKPDERGLHALAYVLYGADGRSTATDLDPRRLDWLGALATDLAGATQTLADGFAASGGQRDQLVDAGQAGDTAFPSLAAAAAQVVQGMVQEADAVGKTKLAAPQATHDATRVEGRFSTTSVSGFVANLQGIQDVYLGTVPAAGTQGQGLSAWVAARDPALDGKVRAALQNALDAVGRVPQPFTQAIDDPADSGQIENAAAQVQGLETLLSGSLLPRIRG